MPAPYLRRVWLDPAAVKDRDAYPFCLPFLRDGFELDFDRPITIIAGENGNPRCSKALPCWPVLTSPVAARAICPSIIRNQSR